MILTRNVQETDNYYVQDKNNKKWGPFFVFYFVLFLSLPHYQIREEAHIWYRLING
jgi:hypothetical protein